MPAGVGAGELEGEVHMSFSATTFESRVNREARRILGLTSRGAAKVISQGRKPLDRSKKEYAALEGRNLTLSFPQISFINFDFVPFQQRDEFLLESNLSMVNYLIGDVLLDRVQAGKTHGKRTVAGLPSKRTVFRKCVVNRLRRIHLNESHCVGNRQLFADRNEKMNVIGHTSRGDQPTLVFCQNAADVFVQPLADVVADHWSAIFGAEDNVIVQAGE
jgi:hypothetical protein